MQSFGRLSGELGDEREVLVVVEHDEPGELGARRDEQVGDRRCTVLAAVGEEALAEFLDDKRHSRSQIEFVNLIIDELTERGVVAPGRVYEDPYVGLAPQGPEDLFAEDELERLFSTPSRLSPIGRESET